MTAIIQFVSGYTSNVNLMRFQNYIWRKLSRLPISYFDKNEPRDLISRTTQDTVTMSEVVSYGISSIISVLYTFVGSAVMIFGYDWRLVVSMGIYRLIMILVMVAGMNLNKALMMALLIPCIVIANIPSHYMRDAQHEAHAALVDYTNFLAERLGALKQIKAFGAEGKEGYSNGIPHSQQ